MAELLRLCSTTNFFCSTAASISRISSKCWLKTVSLKLLPVPTPGRLQTAIFLWTFATSKWATFFSATSSHCTTSDLPLAVVNDKLGDAKWMTECKNAWMDVVSCLIWQWHCKVRFMELHQTNGNATFQNRFLFFFPPVGPDRHVFLKTR